MTLKMNDKIVGLHIEFNGVVYIVGAVAKHTEENKRFSVYVSNKEEESGFYLCSSVDDLEKISSIPSYDVREDLSKTKWEHFKSTKQNPMTYTFLCLGVEVDSLDKFVLYRPLYGSGKELMKKQDVTCLARPSEMFFGNVERDGYNGPRFRRI